MAKTSGVVEVSSLHRTEVFVSHRNARLTAHGRRILVDRVLGGRPVAHAAAEMGISRPTAHKRIRRRRAEGDTGLADRSSGPHRTPHRTPRAIEARVCDLRRTRKLGPARIGPVPGRQAGRATRSNMGFDYIRSAIDDHSRLAYSEIHPEEKAATCAGFLTRAAAFLHRQGIPRVERILTDNAWAYRKALTWKNVLADFGATRKPTRAYRPQINGKVERFNRTPLQEWAHIRPCTSNTDRAEALTDFLHTYNHHRCHTALGGRPPTSPVNTPAGQYT